MFDLGRTLLAVVDRSPDALAIVDGERRLTYAASYGEIGRVAGGLAALCLSRRDHSAKLALLHRERSPPPPHGARVEEVGA
jgi:non-ribosomal peptide synthetase component E (peptide arylation enzyme)